MTTTMETSDVEAGGFRIRLNRAGPRTGEAILFLHGSGPGATGLSNYAATVPAFADDYDCLVIDQVGWGDSSHPAELPPSGRVRQLVLSNLALLDALGLDRVHLVGNSLGGVVALNMLTAAPERIGKVVGMGAGGGGNTAPTGELLKLIEFYNDPTLESMKQLISYMLYDPDLFGAEIDAIARDRLETALRPDVRRSHLLTFGLPGPGPGLPGLRVPETSLRRIDNDVLLVHGREDSVVPAESSEWLARRIPNARLHVVPHCGHWAQIEQTDRFVQLSTLFLRGRI
ncbi:2-hydroxy-6-oxo-6-phenylhexa-2,4-dienoate hydrolase [Rhodococcus ruber]|uniref:alpha/beta fold hydrolase n=1 Tax=Rhodococcus ruber TaxID=1830 RepID=UPI00315D84F5